MLKKTEKEHFQTEGYLIKRKVFNQNHIGFLQEINFAIDQMAEEIGVSTNQYLDSVCRWDSPNKYVENIAKELADELEPLVTACLEQDVKHVRSSIFRKSIKATQGTHGHQDAGYWHINSSNIYDISSWVAFEDVDKFNGALRVLPKSHENRSECQSDFLSKDFVDPAIEWGEKGKTLVMSAGDVAIFNPYLWHASHPSVDGRTRTAFVSRWKSGSFTHKLPSKLIEPNSEKFGMTTSGDHLQKKLNQLLLPDAFTGSIAETIEHALVNNIHEQLPDPARARSSLKKLLILTLASERHYANDTGIGIWQEIRDSVIMPIGVEKRTKSDKVIPCD